VRKTSSLAENAVSAGLSLAMSSARSTIETVFAFDETIFRIRRLNSFSQRTTNGRGWLRRNNNEDMRPMPRKTRIRCALPQLVERVVVGSCSLLLAPLRSSLRAGAIRRQCTLADRPRSPQFSELTGRYRNHGPFSPHHHRSRIAIIIAAHTAPI
jgi:hypothetical protein